MGNLAYSVYVRSTRVKAVVSGIIERFIAAILDPIKEELRGQHELITAHGVALDALTVWVESCEQGDNQ